MRELDPCIACGKPPVRREDQLLLLTFTHVTLQPRMLDMAAARLMQGTALMMGGGEAGVNLAAALGFGDRLTTPLGEELHGNVCQECAHTSTLADLLQGAQREEQEA